MAAAPGRWDLEVDLVCVGSGLGATSAAIVAHDLGLRCALLEKAPKLGGLSAFGGGEVFVPANRHMRKLGLDDSKDEGRALRRVPRDGLRQPAPPRQVARHHARGGRVLRGRGRACAGRRARDCPTTTTRTRRARRRSGRYLSVELFDGKSLGEWQAKTFLTPIMPMGALHEEMYEWGGLAKITGWNFELLGQRIVDDQRTFGPGMMGFFVKAAVIDRKIPAFVETPVRELVTEGGRVVGVRAERGGRDFFVRAARGVVLAVGGYDHNKDMACMFENMPDWHGVFPAYLDGDHMVMAPRDRRRDRVGAADEPRALLGLPDPGRGVRGPAALPLLVGVRLPARDLGEREGRALLRRVVLQGLPAARALVGRQEAGAAEPPAVPDLRRQLPRALPARLVHARAAAARRPGRAGRHAARAGREARHRRGRPRAHAGALQRARREGRGPRLRQGLDALGRAARGRPLLQEPERRPARQAAVPRREARARVASASTPTGCAGTRTPR